MAPVVFATDVLLFLLFGIVLGAVWLACRHETLRAPWREVGRRPLAMASLVVLAAYALIGLLDSLHFYPRLSAPGEEARYSTQVYSALDLVLAPLKHNVETSYSAPFASRDAARSVIVLPDGSTRRVFARLKWGGAHLDDPDKESGPDILRRALSGGAVGGALFGALCLVLLLLVARGRVRRAARWATDIVLNRSPIPWYAMLLSGLCLFVLSGAVAALASHYHILGTDKVGQDVLYQSLKSVRTGLVIGTLTTLIMLPFAVFLGLLAGYFRGWVDDAVQYAYTTLGSIPGVLLIAAAIMMLHVYFANHPQAFGSLAQRADMRLLFLCMILGVTSWTGLCRLLRGEALKLREMDYTQAAAALGVGRAQILLRHLLPNAMHIVTISVVLDFSGLVLAEAVLSYLNIGVDPSTYSWGSMINGARLEMAREPVIWWSLAGAFCFMLTLVLAANLFADAVRDAFDPRIREMIGADRAGQVASAGPKAR